MGLPSRKRRTDISLFSVDVITTANTRAEYNRVASGGDDEQGEREREGKGRKMRKQRRRRQMRICRGVRSNGEDNGEKSVDAAASAARN